MTTAYTEALERALGRQLREYERAFDAYREKADALIAGMRARLTETELRCKALEEDADRRITERLASLKDGEPGRDGADGAAGRDGVDGVNGKDGEPGRDGVDGAPGKDADEEAILAALSERVDAKLAEVEHRVTERLATVRDGLDGAPGADGKSVEIEEVLGLVLPHIEAELESRTAPKLAEIGEQVAARLAEVRDGADGRDGIDGKDGRDGVDGKDGQNADPDAIVERVSAALEARVSSMEARVADRLAAVRDGQDGAPGKDGKDGVLPIAKTWADGVHYAGEVVTHDGATWQALRDTGRSPGGDDWICLAAPGAAPKGFTIRGTFAPDAVYQALDIVAMNGSSFVAKQDNPGQCPGEGWQLWASRGKPGQAIKGDTGIGKPGKDGIEVAGFYRDGDELVLTLSDGSEYRA